MWMAGNSGECAGPQNAMCFETDNRSPLRFAASLREHARDVDARRDMPATVYQNASCDRICNHMCTYLQAMIHESKHTLKSTAPNATQFVTIRRTKRRGSTLHVHPIPARFLHVFPKKKQHFAL